MKENNRKSFGIKSTSRVTAVGHINNHYAKLPPQERERGARAARTAIHVTCPGACVDSPSHGSFESRARSKRNRPLKIEFQASPVEQLYFNQSESNLSKYLGEFEIFISRV